MNELILESNNPSFIGAWFIEESICDQLIDFFKENNYFPVSPGTTSNGIDKSIKDSYDKAISPVSQDQRVCSYLEEVSNVLDLYIQKYPTCNNTESSWKIVENFNVQWYPPNGGFKVFHFERNGSLKSIMRYLTFMTYLNDVDDGGETEFYYQNLKVKPQKGLTLIWPVEWTHTHRGIPSPTQEKIIATGWYSFT